MKKFLLACLLVAALSDSAHAATAVGTAADLIEAVTGSGPTWLTPQPAIEITAPITLTAPLTVADPIVFTVSGTGSLNATSGGGLNITGSGTVAFNGVPFHGSTGATIVTVGSSAGTVTFGTGTSFQNNTGASGAAGAVRIDGGKVTFTGTSFTNNTLATGDGGAVNVNGGEATFNNVTLTNNSATAGNGGAVHVAAGAKATFTGTLSATNNSAGASGGAINSAADITLPGGTFRDNTAGASGSGGAVNVVGNLTVTGTPTFTDNSAGTSGGAVSATGTLTLAGGSFNTNSVSNGSGGAINASSVTASSGVTFADNTASVNGGAIKAGSVTLSTGTFTTNKATGGNGGAIDASSVTATGSVTFTGNEAGTTSGAGGAINSTGPVSLAAGSFQDNKASGGAGGAINAGSTVTITGAASFVSNLAGAGSGGAINAPSATVTLAGGTFTTNRATGAASDGGAINGKIVNLTAAGTFSQNTAGQNGGAITANDSASLSGSAFSSNTAGQNGGAVYVAGTVTLANGASFVDNKAQLGDGGGIWTGAGIELPQGAGVTFTGNSADGTTAAGGDGGAVYSGKKIRFYGAVFKNNRALAGSGGATKSGEDSTFVDCIFGGTAPTDINTAELSGGAVASDGGVIADNCNFIGNTAKEFGGAVYFQSGTNNRFDKSYFEKNQAGKDGGAVHMGANNTSVAFRRSLFTGNSSLDGTSSGGGGGAVFVLGPATFDSCTFTLNTATAAANSTVDIKGGAVYAVGNVTFAFTNCTFTRNEARSSQRNSLGGAIYVSGETSMLYCTVTNQNSATFSGANSNGLGGGIYIAGGTFSITASAVAGNAASFGADIFRVGGVTINTGGYNRLGEYGIISQSQPTNYPWASDSNVRGNNKTQDQTGVSQSSMFGNGALAANPPTSNPNDIIIGAAGATHDLLTVALVTGTADNPAQDQIPNREGNLFSSRVDQRNLDRPQPNPNGLFDVGAYEAEQAGGGGPTPDPDQYYVEYVKMSGIPNTMVKIGQTCSLTATVYPTRATQGVTWSSSDPTVARIDQFGNLVSLRRGTTTIAVTSVGIMADGKLATDSVVLVVTDEMSYTNVHPDVWIRLGTFNNSLQPYNEQVYFVDANPATVNAASFQTTFKAAYGVESTQVTELQNVSVITFDSKSTYTGSNWVSTKPSIGVSLAALSSSGGSVLPLEYTWNLDWDEVSGILGKTVTTVDNATELFQRLKLVFESVNGATTPVVDADGEYGIAASKAVSSGALTMTNGNNGLTLKLKVLPGDVAGNGKAALIDNTLVVADGVMDGTISGSMWLLKRTGSSVNGGGGSSGGGCSAGWGAVLLLPAVLFALRRRYR
ncbi:MAG: Ig-like domain-containing protein [Synergistaceae bacterium]|jgi:predicted outer membrane repeat protein|nr:Ig-like domain-containing protein [Synergistaceae bacterium]